MLHNPQKKYSSNEISDSPKEHAAPIGHTAREYHAYPGSKDVLPADDLERQRLSLQHNTSKILGNRTLLAPVSLNDNDQVLEIGAGPRFWILDFAKTLDPSIRMVAVDIESRLFPTSAPQNIEFRVASATNLPSEWSDTTHFRSFTNGS
ncbi:hypothetical protein B0H14DRAFT_3123078 [Mycena olivaceomarginata]|nr:hypothetical protein B0H14DRAFT_3123078 [Mycena olivaceomarginata]